MIGVIAFGSSGSHPALWGNDVIDEPTIEQIKAAKSTVEAYYAAHSDMLPLVNLFPLHRSVAERVGSEPLETWKKVLLPGTTYGSKWYDAYRNYAAAYITTLDTDYISFDQYPYFEINGKHSTTGNWLGTLDTRTGDTAKADLCARPCRGAYPTGAENRTGHGVVFGDAFDRRNGAPRRKRQRAADSGITFSCQAIPRGL